MKYITLDTIDVLLITAVITLIAIYNTTRKRVTDILQDSKRLLHENEEMILSIKERV